MRSGFFVAFAILLLTGCAAGPVKDDAAAEEGYRAYAAGDLLAAEHYLTQALAGDPNNPQLLLTLGEVYQNTGRPELARAHYLQVLALAPAINALPVEAERRQALLAVDRAGDNLKRIYLAERGELPQPEPVAMVVQGPRPFDYWVQLGFFVGEGNAERLWQQVSSRHPDLVAGKEVHYVEMDGGTKVRIGPYATKAEADAACARLRQAGTDCFPGRHQ